MAYLWDKVKALVASSVSGKQDVIDDLAAIRSGAAKGETALQSHQDISGKQDVLESGTNIKTINGQSVLGSGDITIPKGDKGDKGDTVEIELEIDTSTGCLMLTKADE